ncbi:hypothetical protein CU098_009947, partial [Rhizopus stolonifer]
GLCGSGKSEMHQWILYHLVTLSSTKKPSKIQQMVQKAYSALEAFLHAKNTVNENASCAGKYLSLQFNERGRMTGAKFSNFMLEKSRIAHTSGDERNFHIFYYVLFGSSNEEKTELYLNETPNYPYLFRTKEASRLASGLATEYTEKYDELKTLLKSLGIGRSTLLQITQIIAAILHLGNIQFVDDVTNAQDSAIVKNMNELDIVADLLGVESKALETCLTYQTKLIKRDLTTIFLNSEQAALQRDALAETLYTLLVAWLTDVFNKKLYKSEFQNFIGIVDFPGVSLDQQNGSYAQFCTSYANEKLYSYMMNDIFEKNIQLYSVFDRAAPSSADFVDSIEFLDDPLHGLIASFSEATEENVANKSFMNTYNQHLQKNPQPKIAFGQNGSVFTIQHFTGLVTYSSTELANGSIDKVSADFVSLFSARNASEQDRSSSHLLKKIFSPKFVAKVENTTTESVPDSQNNTTDPNSTNNNRMKQFKQDISTLMDTINTTKTWFVICLRSNDLLLPNSCDAKKLAVQSKLFKLLPLVNRAKFEYTIQMDLQEFCDRYVDIIHATSVDLDAELRDKWLALRDAFDWNDYMMAEYEEKAYINSLRINSLLNGIGWVILENKLRAIEKREQRRARCIAKGIPFDEEDGYQESIQFPPSTFRSMTEMGSVYSEDCYDGCYQEETGSVCSNQCESILQTTVTLASDDDKSRYRFSYEDDNEVYSARSMHRRQQESRAIQEKDQAEDKPKTTKARGCWLIMTWIMTWWVPSFFLQRMCGMKRADIRMAWREKLTLCCLIFLLCGVMIWFIAFFGQLVCPHIDLYTQSELQAKNDKDNAYIAIRGEVFDLTSFAPRHWASEVIPSNALFQYAGQDASDLFPVQVSALCDGIDGTVPREVTLDAHINITDSNAVYHDFRSFREDYRPDWYFEQMVYLRRNYRLGFMGYDPVDIKNQASYPVQIGGINRQRLWAIIHENVYDLTSYMMGGRSPRVAEGQPMPLNINMDFIDNSITELFRQLAGTDISAHFDSLPLDKTVRERQLICLRNLFLVVYVLRVPFAFDHWFLVQRYSVQVFSCLKIGCATCA